MCSITPSLCCVGAELRALGSTLGKHSVSWAQPQLLCSISLRNTKYCSALRLQSGNSICSQVVTASWVVPMRTAPCFSCSCQPPNLSYWRKQALLMCIVGQRALVPLASVSQQVLCSWSHKTLIKKNKQRAKAYSSWALKSEMCLHLWVCLSHSSKGKLWGIPQTSCQAECSGHSSSVDDKLIQTQSGEKPPFKTPSQMTRFQKDGFKVLKDDVKKK